MHISDYNIVHTRTRRQTDSQSAKTGAGGILHAYYYHVRTSMYAPSSISLFNSQTNHPAASLGCIVVDCASSFTI